MLSTSLPGSRLPGCRLVSTPSPLLPSLASSHCLALVSTPLSLSLYPCPCLHSLPSLHSSSCPPPPLHIPRHSILPPLILCAAGIPGLEYPLPVHVERGLGVRVLIAIRLLFFVSPFLLVASLPSSSFVVTVAARRWGRRRCRSPPSLSLCVVAIAVRRRLRRCPSPSSSLSVIVFVVVRCLLRFLSSSFPSLFGSFPPTSLWSSLPRLIVVSPLVVFSGVIWSWWRGQRQGHGKMDNENELRQTSWLAFRDSPMGLPTSWVPLRLPPSTDPPSNESEPPTSLWKGQGQW